MDDRSAGEPDAESYDRVYGDDVGGMGMAEPCCVGRCSKCVICNPLLGLLGGAEVSADGGGNRALGEVIDGGNDDESYPTPG